jgi:hypothetical protein
VILRDRNKARKLSGQIIEEQCKDFYILLKNFRPCEGQTNAVCLNGVTCLLFAFVVKTFQA